ncbi:hypothetical protein CN330_23840 [Priestia megaterium]|uniref:hypothetical protein n=1 Tax=Priestia megaterium TaxID=1404 RepID=UPI000BF948E1|nr:hypothetical protein [Priestia megaterium]PEZ08795.1 hypothetical protein CN330_23840 [Priestia megaterium]
MAKGKYEKWITEEHLVLLEVWARGGLTDEQMTHIVNFEEKSISWLTKTSIAYVFIQLMPMLMKSILQILAT